MDVTTTIANVRNEDVQAAFKALKSIGAISSNLDKKDLLNRQSNNPALKLILYYTYNPFLVYYLKEVPEVQKHVPQERTDWSTNLINLIATLDLLADRSLTGNAALSQLAHDFETMSETEDELYRRVIKKDLNIGIKAKTINTVFCDLIPEFGVQLAKDYDGKLPSSILIQPKLDGYRAVGETGSGRLFSRNGKEIKGYDDIAAQLKLLPAGYYLDGEIMSNNFKGTQQNAFAHTSGKIGVYNVFDISEGQIGSDKDQHTRSKDLLEFLGVGQEGHRTVLESIPNIVPVHSWLIKGGSFDSKYDEMLRYYQECLDQGYEGIMIKDADAAYELKRGRNWQKMKPVNSVDLKVIRVEAGAHDTKYANCVGKLIVSYEGCEVGVGSGLSDQQRQLWWDNPTLIVGKTIEVLYQEATSNQNGGVSLRFPRFKCIRSDK